MGRSRSIRTGKVFDFCLRARENGFVSDLLAKRGFEFDVPSRSFLMNDRDFVSWIGRGDRFARVMDAYAVADGNSRFAAELVAGLCFGQASDLLGELERVLGVH